MTSTRVAGDGKDFGQVNTNFTEDRCGKFSTEVALAAIAFSSLSYTIVTTLISGISKSVELDKVAFTLGKVSVFTAFSSLTVSPALLFFTFVQSEKETNSK